MADVPMEDTTERPGTKGNLKIKLKITSSKPASDTAPVAPMRESDRDPPESSGSSLRATAAEASSLAPNPEAAGARREEGTAAGGAEAPDEGDADSSSSLLNKMLCALNKLVELDKFLLFVQPVEEWFAPNYFSVIKQPMDFSTMYTRVLDEEYASWEPFEADFELICANAMLYNAKGSKVYTLAAKLRDRGRRVLHQAKRPPREVRRTLVITHKECANHITPGSFGQDDMMHMGADKDSPAEGAELAAAAASLEGAEEEAKIIHSIPEQPARILQVWSDLAELQYEINGVRVVKTEELTTSPTMNAHLDDTLAASSRAAEAREKRGNQMAAAPIPLLSRTATYRQGTAGGQAGDMEDIVQQLQEQRERDEKQGEERRRASQTGDGGRLSPFNGPESSSVFKEEEEAEEAGAVDDAGLMGGGLLQRTQSSAFMLSWVQPAVQKVHNAAYLERIAKEIERLRTVEAAMSPGETRPLLRCVSMTQRGDTYISPRSLHAALCASYTVCRAVDQVMAQNFRNAFCCIRPPGHHAGPNGSTKVVRGDGEDTDTGDLVGQGFCLINHVAVGARYALSSHAIKRVAIIDWDLHHGNGTQACCLEGSRPDAEGMPDMLFCSLHGASAQDEEFALFPGTARATQVDLRRGIVNIPLRRGTKPTEYMELFKGTLCQAVKDYKPDLIFISAGFDAHKDDMFRFLKLSDHSYKAMTEAVMDIAESACNGRVVSVLEGGYTVSTLAQCCKVHVKALATHDQPDTIKEASGKSKTKGAMNSGLAKLRRIHSLSASDSSAASTPVSGTSNTAPAPALANDDGPSGNLGSPFLDDHNQQSSVALKSPGE